MSAMALCLRLIRYMVRRHRPSWTPQPQAFAREMGPTEKGTRPRTCTGCTKVSLGALDHEDRVACSRCTADVPDVAFETHDMVIQCNNAAITWFSGGKGASFNAFKQRELEALVEASEEVTLGIEGSVYVEPKSQKNEKRRTSENHISLEPAQQAQRPQNSTAVGTVKKPPSEWSEDRLMAGWTFTCEKNDENAFRNERSIGILGKRLEEAEEADVEKV